MKKNIYFFLYLFFLLVSLFTANVEIKAEDFPETYFNPQKMNEALDHYENVSVQGGWSKLPETKEYKEGDYCKTINLLKTRLILTNDLPKENKNDPFFYDKDLTQAVRNFQFRHGLNITGKADLLTIKALNVPVEKRIQQIKLNLDQMKNYLEIINEDKYIIVNIPNFDLQVINNNKIVLNMKVIVGSKESQTPTLNSNITHLVLNPTWIIPYHSSVVNILPKIKKDPKYIENNSIKVFRGWGDNSIEINPNTINWSLIKGNNLIYRFIQEPGPNNAMGLVKFKFPNNFNISLHDTPDKSLFFEKSRTFSAGCIRLEKPIELAQYILMEYMEPKSISKIIENNITKTIYLKERLRIYLVYWTVWVTDTGTLHFRNDIYHQLH